MTTKFALSLAIACLCAAAEASTVSYQLQTTLGPADINGQGDPYQLGGATVTTLFTFNETPSFVVPFPGGPDSSAFSLITFDAVADTVTRVSNRPGGAPDIQLSLPTTNVSATLLSSDTANASPTQGDEFTLFIGNFTQPVGALAGASIQPPGATFSLPVTFFPDGFAELPLGDLVSLLPLPTPGSLSVDIDADRLTPNDIVSYESTFVSLRVVPEPSTAALAMLACLLVGRRV